NDRFPMWYRNRVYFVSDRAGRMNIFSMTPRGNDIRQHTAHTSFDVAWPDLAPDGRIVYMHGGGLRVYDIESDEDRLIEVTIASNRLEGRSRFEAPEDTVDGYDIAPDGDWVLISSRGEFWRVPVDEGRTIEVTDSTSGVRERSPAVGPDGEQIAAITDETGEQEIAIFDAAGRSEQRILTAQGRGWLFDPVWSPDGSKIAYADLTKTLYVLDVETGEASAVDRAEGWEITDYSFSPDSAWLAYSRPWEPWGSRSSIWVYDIDSNARYPVTTDFSHDVNPAWDPNGRYLYFLSGRRFNPMLGERDFQHIVTETTIPCAIMLRKDGRSPFLSPEVLAPDADDLSSWWSGEIAADKTSDDDGTDSAAHGEDVESDDESDVDNSHEVVVEIDLRGIEDRIVEFPVEPGNYRGLQSVDHRLLYLSWEPEGLLDEVWGSEDERPRFTLHMFDMVEREDIIAIDALRDFVVSDDGDTIAWRSGQSIQIASLDALSHADGEPEADDEVDPGDLRLRVDPAAEWRQIFDEAWRLQRDFFWSEDMAGIDWRAMYDKYLDLLPRIGTRQELNSLIGEMIAELGTSHTYVWGGDTEDAEGVGVGLLGADLVPHKQVNALQFTRVLRAENWETDIRAPLAMSHANVQEGEFLFEINGYPVTAETNVYDHLAGLENEEGLLTGGPNSSGEGVREIQIETLSTGEAVALRYADWVRRNREEVNALTQGRVGYMHLPDMGGPGLVEFIKAFYPQTDKDALIIDVRYNGGGFVSQMIIERLAREVWAWDRSRSGRPGTYPSKVHIGPKVVIVNQNSGSDGDIFPESFKLRGLGPIVGTRTWGGVVGIRADKPFVDFGFTTQPEFAFWQADRGWGLENRGVEPDVVVDFTPEDYREGRDPQLRAAADIVMNMLRENPPMQEPKWTPPPNNRPRIPRGDRR
ncbi:MAG: S41 family peptidase, partial [Planctomycetota bacterium]